MKRVFKTMKPYWGYVALIVLFIIGNVFAELVMPTYIANIINFGIANHDWNYILRTGGFMLLFAVLSVVCQLLVGYNSARVSSGLSRDLRSMVFRRVEAFSMGEIDHFSTASLITRTTNDITQIQNFMMVFLRIIIMAPLMFVGSIIMAAGMSRQMSNVLFVSMPLLIILVVCIAKVAIPLSTSLQKKLDRLNLVMREKLTGIRVIRAFGTEDHEEKRFQEANADLTKTTIKMQRIMSFMMPMMMLLMNMTGVVLVWSGAVNVSAGNLMVGNIIAVVQYVMQIMMSLMMISMIFVMYPRAAASAKRIDEIITTEPMIKDHEGALKEGKTKGCVEFKDVTFRYPHGTEPALEEISFKVNPGETTAIIGSTGSGKSALVKLILRFYDVEKGQVLVDGVDVRDYDQDALRRKIGYVPQKSVLFSGTIAENIRYGKEDATDEELQQAAVIAQADDFIEEKEKKFDEPVARGGTNVSGGQRQRLAIARAIVRKPEIYIFDDSFSALDFKTDAKLREALAQQTKEAAVLIVAQRVSTIMNADQILVLEEGHVVGKGTHSELLQNCEVYREIVHSQLTKEEMQ